MLIVPTAPLANQTFTVLLANQPCRIDLVQKSNGMFMTIYVNDALLLAGVICENRNRIVRSRYLGFTGDLEFRDIAGNADPVYTGLNSRFFLCYLEAADIA